MSVLARKILRDLWIIRWRAVMVVVTVAAGVGIYAGIGMAFATGAHTRDTLLARMRFADLEVQLLPEDVANLPDLTRVPGVRAVERRLVLPGTAQLPGGTQLPAILVFLENSRPSINALELIAGRMLEPTDFESGVAERSLAMFHGIRTGDRIRTRVGHQVYETRIDGVVISPEWLIATANPTYVIPEKGSMGVVYAALDRVSDALGFTMVNDLLFHFEPGADRRTVTDAIVARLARFNIERVIPKEEHYIWRHLEVARDAFAAYTPSTILTLGVLAFVLTVITVNRLVLDQRRQLGALLALGYGRRHILRVYVRTGALLGALGGALGVGLAFVFRDIFAGAYAHAIGMPEVVAVVTPRVLAIGFVAAVAGTALATALPVWRMLRRPPQTIIRTPVADAADVRRRLRWMVAPMARLPVTVRFGLRNMIRSPARTISTILAIGLSLGVSIAYMVSNTSALVTPELAFARERWDATVDFLYPVPLSDVVRIAARPGVERTEPYLRRFAELGVNGRYEHAALFGIEPTSQARRPVLKDGRFLGGAADEVVVSQDLARRLALRVGNVVDVRIRSGRAVAARVVGISGDVIPAQVMMSLPASQHLTELEDSATGMYVTATIPPSQLTAILGALEHVAKVGTKAGVTEAFRKFTGDMLALVYVSAGVSVVIAMLFIVMSVNFVVSERQAEYATLKCLGYGRGRLRATVLAQALGEGGLAAMLSVPVGICLAVYLNGRVSEAWYDVQTIVRVTDVAQILGAALVLIPLAAYPALRTLHRMNIAAALGTRTIE